ncbi:MAG: hypothetical protein COU27_02350 [Candidatus Levybacteria bacterium CG10_big_fil_rev_8_21_14_0_10_36_7]|nr:MAG: hypothetical protein COU27_02350 [Candidatus Levybacteria bacterium CG10_big_fil_rev_8_21_14_0_10_36_7]
MEQRIIFFGSGYYVIPIVEKLLQHNLLLVVTTEIEGKFVNYLRSNNIPFVQSKLKAPEDINKITELTPTLGILASYGAIIPTAVIDLFPNGILNIHPSLLPKYKGPSPIQYAILDGAKKTGITIIKLDDQVDHGPIILQKETSLDNTETLKNLTEKLFFSGAEMIQEIIQKLENGLSLKKKVQASIQTEFTQKIKKQDGYIDFDNPPSSIELDRKIRAFYPWPTVWFKTKLNGSEKLIKLLPHKMIQVEGKNPMNLKDFANGYSQGEEILQKLSFS